MGQQTILNGKILDGKFLDFKQEFSEIRDKLNILKEEEAKLSAIWQGEAKEAWEQVFVTEMAEAEACLQKSIQAVALLKDQALKLKKEEQEILALAGNLSG